MWLFPALSIFTVVGIVAILAQMGIEQDSRSQLILSLLSWAVVIVFYFANKWFIARRPVPQELAPTVEPRRVLVLANETANSAELLDELRRIGADRAANYFVVVPASPIETGVAATHGPLDVMEATQEAAKARLDHTLSTLRSENLRGRRRAGGLPAAAGTGQRGRHLPPGSDRDRDAAARRARCGIASTSSTGPAPSTRHPGDPCRGDPGAAAQALPNDDHRGVQLEQPGQRAAEPGGAAGPHHRREGHRRGGRGAGAAGRGRPDRGRVPGLPRRPRRPRRSSGWSTSCAATSTSP